MLRPEDPAPFETVNPQGAAPCLIVCDHASRIIPAALGDMGLSEAARREHIAWDIGAAEIARRLAQRLDAPAVLAGFSRLVIDCNRYLDDPALMVETSDTIAVPANRNLSDGERAARVGAIYRPYHNAIEDALEVFEAAGAVPFFISVHTMTRCMRGRDPRREQFTLCWLHDDRVARPLLARLAERTDITYGDNVPYGLDPEEDYTVPEHAMKRGLPHLQFEVRQDLVADEKGAHRWADLIYDLTADLVLSPDLRRIEHFWP